MSGQRIQPVSVTRVTWSERLRQAPMAKKDRPWSEEELEIAVGMRDRNIPYRDIAITLSRSVGAIRARLLRLVPPEERQEKHKHNTREKLLRRLRQKMAEGR